MHHGPKDVRVLSLFQFLYIISTDHLPISYDTELTHIEARADPIDYRNKGFDISRIPRPHLATHGFTLIVYDRSYNHLIEIRAVILAVSFYTNSLSS